MIEVKVADKATQDLIKTAADRAVTILGKMDPSEVAMATKSALESVATNVTDCKTTLSGVNIYSSRIDSNAKKAVDAIGASTDAASATGTTIFSLLKYIAAK